MRRTITREETVIAAMARIFLGVVMSTGCSSQRWSGARAIGHAVSKQTTTTQNHVGADSSAIPRQRATLPRATLSPAPFADESAPTHKAGCQVSAGVWLMFGTAPGSMSLS